MNKQQIFLFCIPIVVLLFVFRDVLFFGKFFFTNDTLLSNLPFLWYRGQDGAVIIQHILSGFPLFVTVNASWFYPVSTFLFSHMQATTAYIMLSMANMLLVYPFTYLYARKINLSPAAAALAAMTFTFSGEMMLWAQSIIATAFYFLLPAALYFVELSFEKKWPLRILILTVLGTVLGTGWLASQVQFVVYIHVFYAAYVAFRVIMTDEKKSWGVFSASLSIPYLVSFCVGLPTILSVLSFQTETLRASGVALADYMGAGYLPTNLIHLFLPFWNVYVVPLGLANLYMGIVPLMLLVITLGSYKKIQNAYLPFFAGTFVFCLLASIKYSPVLIAMHYLPLWNAFREAPRIMFVGAFAGALLAGIGLDYVRTQWGNIDFYRTRAMQFFLRAFLFVALPVFTLFTIVRLFFFDAIKSEIDAYVLVHIYPHTTGLPKEHYFAVVGNYLHQVLDQVSFFDPQVLFLVIFTGAAFWLFASRERISAERFAFLAVLSVALNFACVYGWRYVTIDTQTLRDIPHTVSAIQAREKDSPSPFRFTSLFPAMTVYTASVACPMSPDEIITLQTELLQPNAGIFYNLDAVEGYENFMPARVSDALGYIGSESTAVANPLFLERIPLEQKLQKILDRKNILKAMNVKYVVSGTSLTDPELSLVNSWQIGHCKNVVYLYELHGTWPRYFITNNVAQATSSPDAVVVLNELNTHQTPTVLMNDILPFQKLGKRSVTEVLPIFGARDIQFASVSCDTACTLFVGNTFLKNWSATVDGVPATIYRANYMYMVLLLTPGTHQVVLRYAQPF